MQTLNEQRIDDICRKLHDSGHRMTPQRLCILQALVGSNRHPSAEEIFAEVQRVSPMTSLATVYKTLETLRDMGEALEMEVGDGRRHYDGVRPQFHPHVICTHCGQIEDIEIGGLTGLQAEARQISGYQIQTQRVEFYGLCRVCQNTEKDQLKD